MVKILKIVSTVCLAAIFSVAALEIDVFDYDNTFFDTYDTYVNGDSKAVQHIPSLEFNECAPPEVIPFTYYAPQIEVHLPKEPRSIGYFYRPKLFLVQSSLLI